MKITSGRTESDLHHVQSWSNSCQAACLAIALAGRTESSAQELETSMHGAPFNGPGHTINSVGLELEGRVELSCLARDAALMLRFRTALRRGARIVVHVAGPVWVSLLVPLSLQGPHGTLCAASERAMPIHSVVIVAEDSGRFFILDPFLNPNGQPLEVTDDELRNVLVGFPAVIVQRD